MRAGESELAHAHAPAAALVDQRDSCEHGFRVGWIFWPRNELGVDGVDDLNVARKQMLEEVNRPLSSASGSSVYLV